MTGVQTCALPILVIRRHVDSLLKVEDRVLYLAGVFAWTGFNQVSIPLVKTPRASYQKSTYNLSRKLIQVVDSFASFTIAPLLLIFVTGVFIWLGSVLYAALLLVQKLIYPSTVLSGFTSTMLSLWFLGGTVILFLGILGLYVAKIFQEIKRRPLYIIRDIYRGRPND